MSDSGIVEWLHLGRGWKEGVSEVEGCDSQGAFGNGDRGHVTCVRQQEGSWVVVLGDVQSM